jgi:hypothetical protein
MWTTTTSPPIPSRTTRSPRPTRSQHPRPRGHELWAVGLRNPWRCSFDRLTGDLWIGDVGEAASGEIDWQPAAVGGLNYGWPCMEGLVCHTPSNGCTCHDPVLTLPIYDHGRDGTATIGGYVYRGSAIPELQGTYLFADYSGLSWSLRLVNGSATELVRRNMEIPSSAYSSFGEDSSGELYLCSLFGQVFKIVRGCYANCDGRNSIAPILNVNDFLCFSNQFAADDPRANCDGSTEPPLLSVADFSCFMAAFANGCP